MKVFTELSQVETTMLAINRKLFLFGLISTELHWLNCHCLMRKREFISYVNERVQIPSTKKTPLESPYIMRHAYKLHQTITFNIEHG